MGDGTKIEWTDAIINPIRARRELGLIPGMRPETRMGWHCEHVSEACRNCYAEAINRDRFGTGLDYKPGHLAAKGGEVEIVFIDKPIREMLRWRRPRRIFVCSMTDLFADFVSDEMIDRVFAAAALCPQHTIQILTKRPDRMRAYVTARANGWQGALATAFAPGTLQVSKNDIERAFGRAQKFSYDPPTPIWPLPNVWLGVTAERQQEADERIPILLDTPAAKRFVSIEPMLGPIDLRRIAMPEIEYETGIHYQDVLRAGSWSPKPFFRPSQPDEPQIYFTNHHDTNKLNWVICGGERGPGARPMHPDWARSLRDQCAAAGVPFFFKQWGEWASVATDDRRATRGLRARTDGRFDSDWDDWNPATDTMVMNVGKARAGRLLDGVTHDAFPGAAE